MVKRQCFNCKDAWENADGILTGDYCQYHPCFECDLNCTDLNKCNFNIDSFDCIAWEPIENKKRGGLLF